MAARLRTDRILPRFKSTALKSTQLLTASNDLERFWRNANKGTNMIKRLPLLLSVFLLTLNSAFPQRITPETRILTQSTSPIKILSYSGTYAPSGSRYVDRGIHHELEFENTSGRNIVAIEFGLVSFDVWNEFLDRTGGITMQLLEAGKKDKGEWVASRYSDFSFHTGVAYVSKVRFDNGEIWSADTNAVLAEMRKIQKDFDAAELKKKPGEKP